MRPGTSSEAGFFREVLWASVLAVGLVSLGGGIWLGLLSVNLARSPWLPWSVPAMGVLLVLAFTYLGGHWGPGSPGLRNEHLRARALPPAVFRSALVAGGLATVALAGLWFVLFRVAGLPAERPLGFSRYPAVTLVLTIVMGSLVSAVTEEAGFRGYLQGTLERRLPGPAAITLAALLLAPAHALTQGFAWPVFVFYLLVDLAFGAMAFLTKSIVPGLAVHTAGLVGFFALVWQGDALRSAGLGDPFKVHVAQVAVFGLLAVLAFVNLRRRL